MDTDDPYNKKNPIIKEFDGQNIRRDNFIKIKFNPTEYERLLRLSKITGIPMTKIVALSSQPCPICGNDHVAITIPLGLLSTKKQLTGNSANFRKNDNKG